MSEVLRDVPGLKGEVVCDVWLQVEQSLLLPLTLYTLAFLFSQTPLFYLHKDGVWEMAPHYKQRTENHLEREHHRSVLTQITPYDYRVCILCIYKLYLFSTSKSIEVCVF